MTTTMIRKQESKEFDFPKFSAGPGSVVIRPARGTGSVGVFAMAPNGPAAMRREHRSCAGKMPHRCMFCAVLFMG